MYQLKYVPNTETHACAGTFIVIVDENGREVGDWGFGTQERAFDYIKTKLNESEELDIEELKLLIASREVK